jgi:hypothetical protein
MDIETSKRKLRLISGRPEAVDVMVNELLEEYSPSSWTYQVVGDQVIVTCMLILNVELRKAQIASIAPPNGRGR